MLLVTAGVFFARLSKQWHWQTTSEQTLLGDEPLQLHELIESQTELQTLYDKLGYSVRLDQESRRIVADLKATIRTEVPDFPAFLRGLEDAKAQINLQVSASLDSTDRSNDHDLLNAVLAAGGDQARILELLNRNPVYEQLPFVEQIPIHKNGEIIWRTPLEHTLIRKRPTDPARFAELLNQLESMFKDARTLQAKQLQREVVEVIARTRRDLQKQTAYLATPLQALEKKVADYIQNAPSAASQIKIKQLDALLRELIGVEHRYNQGLSDESQVASFKQAAQHLAKTYLDLTWAQTSWLSMRVLAMLINAEVAELPKDSKSATALALKAVRDEVALGSYDCEETIRRLQQQEERGLFVNSLVYPLLRLNSAPQVIIKKAAT